MLKPIFFYSIYILIFGIFLIPTEGNAFNHSEKFLFSREFHKTKFSTEMDYRYDGTFLNYRHYDFGVRPPLPFLGKGWSSGFHYRIIHTTGSSGIRKSEMRPHVQIQKKFRTKATDEIPDIKWAIRSRQEYRMRENGDHTSRNRSRIKLTFVPSELSINPFISSEIFYDFDANEVVRNRAELGFSFKPHPELKTSIFTQINTNRDDGQYESVVTLAIKFEI